LTPLARTRIRAWPGPGTGSGVSRTSITSGSPVRVIQTDRMGAAAGLAPRRRGVNRGLRAGRVLRLSRPMDLSRAFGAPATAFPARECIVTPTRRVTYGAIAERARRLASLLHGRGLGCRRDRAQLANHESGQDHVGLYLLNCPEYVEGMLGCYRARVAPFNVNYRYVDDELVYLLDDADAVALVYHARYAPTLARIRARLPRLRLLLQVD